MANTDDTSSPALSKKDKALCKKWDKAVIAADRLYREWEDEFAVDILEDFWKGHQWQDDGQRVGDKYTVNLTFASVETRLPSLAFYRPRIRITPRPNRTDDPASFAAPRMKLLEDTSNTILSDRNLNFMKVIQLAVRDAHVRFGVVEVGYSADTTENPQAGKPVLVGEGEEAKEARDSEGNPVTQPDRTINNESIYLRIIPAKQFRFSVSDKNFPQHNDWVGYYEWVHWEDIDKNPNYQNRAGIKGKARGLSGNYSPKDGGTTETRDSSDKNVDGLVKLWKMWDIRGKTRYVFTGDFDRVLLQQPYKCFPFSVIKFHEIVDSAYPLPPIFNWLSPQREINEIREMQKIHRRRFIRRYLTRPGALSDDERAKLESGEDGVYAEANGDLNQVLVPVPDAPLDRAIMAGLASGKEDFMQVSGVGGEARGISEADTATQANIIDVNNKVRESFHRNEVGEFVADIVTNIMKFLIEYATLDIWVKTNVDITSPGAMQEMQQIQEFWQQIKIDTLGTQFNWQVEVNVESMTPVTEDQIRNQWNELLLKIAEPGVQSLLLASDTVLRKTLNLYGVRDEREVQEIKQAIFTVMTGRMMEMMAQNGIVPQMPGGAGMPGVGGPPGGGPGPGGPPPNNAAIRGQMKEQMR